MVYTKNRAAALFHMRRFHFWWRCVNEVVVVSGVDKDKVRELWFSGAGLEAGKLIFEAMPVADTPKWAAIILQLCCSQSKPPKEVGTTYQYALRRRKWKHANNAFNKLRARTLKYERSPTHPDPLYGALLHVSEAVAKITYNASGGPAPFDADSGWWLSESLRRFSELTGSKVFQEAAFNLLISPLLTQKA